MKRHEQDTPRPRAIWIRVVLLAAALSLSADTVRADPVEATPCRAELKIDRSVAFVGEQILHRVRVEWLAQIERVVWERAPSFPDHRVESLGAGAETQYTSAEGSVWHAREELRALFAGRSGSLDIPESTLRCVVRNTNGEEYYDLSLEKRVVEARMIPLQGQPPGFDGLIGPIDLRRFTDTRALALGETLQVSLSVRGAGNVWVARLDLPTSMTEPLTDFEVFEAGERSDMSHTDRLVTRRTARFEVVPRRTGRIVLPPKRIVWLDPRTGRFETSSVDPIEIEVLRAPPQDSKSAVRRTDTRTAAGSRESGTVFDPPLLHTILAAVSLVGVSFALGWLLFRARSGRRGLEAALRSAESAHSNGEPRLEAEALERALRSVLAMQSPALAGLSPPELEMRAGQDDTLLRAANLLGELEQIRYGKTTRTPDHAAVRSFIALAIR